MKFDGQAVLGFKLSKPTATFSQGLPSKPDSLQQWINNLPMMKLDQLLHHTSSYIQEMNEVNLADKLRLQMLDMIRPVVAHIEQEIIKSVRNTNTLNLSIQQQENAWLMNVLLREMALGYQRLFANKALKRPLFYNRSAYASLATRVLHYLSERITFIYMSQRVVPTALWHDINSTYRLAHLTHFTESKVNDDFVFKEGMVPTVAYLYKRILLLSIITPYHLRGAQIEQIYSGMLPFIDKVKLKSHFADEKEGYIVDISTDHGPRYFDTLRNIPDCFFIDTSPLVLLLNEWIKQGKPPYENVDQGIKSSLLNEMVTIISGSVKRLDERIPADGKDVEVIVSSEQIDAFLGHFSRLKQDLQSTDELHADEFTFSHQWDKRSTVGDWDQFIYTTIDAPKDEPQVKPVSPRESKDREVKKFCFQIENTSTAGVCLQCDMRQAQDLTIGTLLMVLGATLETSKLGIVRWMKIDNNKVNAGVFFLGSEVDSVNLTLESDNTNEKKAFWLQGGTTGASLLIPTKQLKSGDVVHTMRQGMNVTAILHEVIWQNEVFSQFGFELVNLETSEQDYLIPSWEK